MKGEAEGTHSQMASVLAKEESKLPLENDWGRVWERIGKN